MPELESMSRERLIVYLQDAAKLWLAHDGLWFQAVERAEGMDTAIRLDGEAMERFCAIEAARIIKRLGLAPGGGLRSLATALDHRLYALINRQEVVWEPDGSLTFLMRDCRVQSARRRKGLDDFPCKPVGQLEYQSFARAIDERIVAECIACPPDPPRPDFACGWRFRLVEGG